MKLKSKLLLLISALFCYTIFYNKSLSRNGLSNEKKVLNNDFSNTPYRIKMHERSSSNITTSSLITNKSNNTG